MQKRGSVQIWRCFPGSKRLLSALLSLALVYALTFAGILDAAHRAHAAHEAANPALAAFCLTDHEGNTPDPIGDGQSGHSKSDLSCCLSSGPTATTITPAAGPALARVATARESGFHTADLFLPGFPPSAPGLSRAPPLAV